MPHPAQRVAPDFESPRIADLPKPEDGAIVTVAPGVSWVRIPLPFRLNHVNVWLLDDGDDLTIIDSGLGDDATRARWDALLTGPLAGRAVTRVIATHFHPDHMGLCGWLVERCGAEFRCGLTDWLYARTLAQPPTPQSVAAARAFYTRAGADDALVTYIVDRGGAYRSLVGSIPPTVNRLRVGDRLTIGAHEWRVIHTAGHTPEPISLYAPSLNILIAGDQVLPRISPNISLWPSEPEADPLRDFLDTFPALRALPRDALVLPSHDRPFTGLHERLDALEAHHAERLDEIAALCQTPTTAAAIAQTVFNGDLDSHQRMFALGEVLAHLNHLRALGRVDREMADDGRHRYRRAG